MPMLASLVCSCIVQKHQGPVKDTKLRKNALPKTAKALWYIYATLNGVCALGYWIAGMSLFGRHCHSFSTVAIGGSRLTTNQHWLLFNRSPIEWLYLFYDCVGLQLWTCIFTLASQERYALIYKDLKHVSFYWFLIQHRHSFPLWYWPWRSTYGLGHVTGVSSVRKCVYRDHLPAFAHQTFRKLGTLLPFFS